MSSLFCVIVLGCCPSLQQSWMLEATGHIASLSGSRESRMLVLSCLSPVCAGKEPRQRLFMLTFRVGLLTLMNLSGNFFPKIPTDIFFFLNGVFIHHTTVNYMSMKLLWYIIC